VILHVTRLAALCLVALVAGCAPAPSLAQAGDPSDYLIQMVCVDAADRAIFADPVDCPDARRKLRNGEPLPYHKLDVGGFQISDSYPVADANGLTLGVQTYFFTDAYDLDPAFPRQVHLDPARGGYNIMGADADWVFFRGTSDPGAYWQPWWTPDCKAQGWLLYPNDRRAFARGDAPSPATFSPGCETRIRTNPSTVEWEFLADHAYVADAADPARTRRLDSIRVRHFAGGYGSMETNYFTREYGATRWEAWTPGEGLTPAFLKTRCPSSTYQAEFHGRIFSMIDCRTWTTVARPEGGAWDPDGASALDPLIRTFPVDPLYTGENLLTNTHVGGPYEPDGYAECDERGWRAVHSPSPLTPGEVTVAPWNGNGACVRTIMAESVPAGAYNQTIDAPPPGAYRFGVSLFAPDLAADEVAPVEVRIVQHDAAGRVLAVTRLTASTIARYRTFESGFTVVAGAAELSFEVSPLRADVAVAVTGAFVAR
jgi:hypothetical protein